MDELKKKLLALEPNVKLLIVAGGALLVMVFYLVLPQLSAGYRSANGAQCFSFFTPQILMSLVMIILPVLTACMTYSGRVVNPLWAYVTTGLYLLFGLINGTSIWFSLASGWWITFIVAAVWTVACALLKGSEVKM